MKQISLYLIIAVIVCWSSGCATIMRSHNTGDSKSGINVISTTGEPAVITVNNHDTPLKSKLLFDASTYSSPYKVYKYYLPRMYKKATLNIAAYNQKETVSISREKDKGWFWIDGLVVWMYEKAAGTMYYYNDVDLTRVFKRAE